MDFWATRNYIAKRIGLDLSRSNGFDSLMKEIWTRNSSPNRQILKLLGNDWKP
jgi:hypothetical protein